jgi:nicotinamidase-related amidase
MKKHNCVEILESLGEIVRPGHTALVVWDVQNGLVNRIFNKADFLVNLGKLIDGLRGKVPVFYTLITPMPPEYRSGWNYFTMMRMFGVNDPARLPAFMALGSPEREIPESVKPKDGDIQIDKATPNIFLGTNFDTMLRNRGIKTVIFSGIATEVGVEHSARDAAARGFYPVVVSDCVSSSNEEAHLRSLAGMSRHAFVATSSEILTSI